MCREAGPIGFHFLTWLQVGAEKEIHSQKTNVTFYRVGREYFFIIEDFLYRVDADSIKKKKKTHTKSATVLLQRMRDLFF